METKHTPGPWVVDPDSPTDISPADDLRLGIASICHADEAGGRWEFGEQSKANAKLIAAAPDLLKALERIARPQDCGCVPCTGSCTSQEALQITVDEMRDLAKAAIARFA